MEPARGHPGSRPGSFGRAPSPSADDDSEHRGDALVPNHAHRAVALVADMPVGMDGDDTPP